MPSPLLRRRAALLVLVTAVFSVVCVRLGIWQLHRLRQRRAQNARTLAGLSAPPVPILHLPSDSAGMHYRRAVVHGRYDYAHEIVLSNRTYNGSPGVNIVTPVRLAGSDRAVLVIRGWVYSPDGMHVDLARWHEGDSVDAVGYAEPFEPKRPGVSRSPTDPIAYRWIDAEIVRRVFPYPVLPLLFVLQGGAPVHAPPPPRGVLPQGAPPRLPPPTLDEGPHMSYAIQWFSFAIIAVSGTAVFLYRTRRGRLGGGQSGIRSDFFTTPPAQ